MWSDPSSASSLVTALWLTWNNSGNNTDTIYYLAAADIKLKYEAGEYSGNTGLTSQ